MKTQAHTAKAGIKKRLKKPSDFSLFIIIRKIGIYIAYNVTIGNSELSKLKDPNQGLGTKFAPKKYSNQAPQRKRPRIEEFAGIFVFLSITLKVSGDGPKSRAASA